MAFVCKRNSKTFLFLILKYLLDERYLFLFKLLYLAESAESQNDTHKFRFILLYFYILYYQNFAIFFIFIKNIGGMSEVLFYHVVSGKAKGIIN